KLLTRLRTLQNGYESANKNLASARRFLEEELAGLENSSNRPFFAEALTAITNELNLDTVARLEPFVNLAEQAAREKQQNRTPCYSAEQLLALAVSGWVLGSGSADPKLETAARLWHSRQFVLDYQRSGEGSSRKSMMAAY